MVALEDELVSGERGGFEQAAVDGTGDDRVEVSADGGAGKQLLSLHQ